MKRKIENGKDVPKKLKLSTNHNENHDSGESSETVSEKFHEIIKDKDINKVREFLQSGCNICDQCIDIANSTHDWEFLKQLLEIYPRGVTATVSNGQPLIFHHIHYLDRLKFMLELGADRSLKSNIIAFAVKELVPLSCLQYLIDYGFDPNATIGRKTPLMLASSYFIVDYVSALLNTKSCNPNFNFKQIGRNILNYTFKSLHKAKSDHAVLTTLKLLLSAVDNPHSFLNNHGRTLLMLSCLKPHPTCGAAVVKLLIDTGADVEATDFMKCDALSYACLSLTTCSVYQKTKLDIVKLLLNAGADPNFKTQSGFTPLMSAIISGNSKLCYDIVKCLIEAGASPVATNRINMTALSYALTSNHDNAEYKLKTVKLLLETGAHISNNHFEFTLRTGKTSNDDVCGDIVKLLLVYMSKETIEKYGLLFLRSAMHFIRDGKVALTIIEHLLAAGVSKEVKNLTELISLASAHPDPVYGPKVVEVLIKAGAPVHVSKSLFFALSGSAPVETFQILLVEGADPNSISKSRKHSTVLMEACKYKNSAIALKLVKLLLQCGADVSSVDKMGNTALMHALLSTDNLPLRMSNRSYGIPAIVDVLLKAGADPSISNKAGLTPLMAAIQPKKSIADPLELLAILLNAGAQPTDDFNKFIESKRPSRIHDILSQMRQAAIDRTKINFRRIKLKIKMARQMNLKGPSTVTEVENESLTLHQVLKTFSDSSMGLQKLQNLLKLGADPNKKCHSDGTTALLVACRINNNYGPSFVNTLLKYGASPSLQDSYGNSPLIETLNHTTSNVTLENVSNLLKAGADPNINDHFGTPIVFSCLILNLYQKLQKDKILKLFIEAGVRTGFKDSADKTLLFHLLDIFAADENYISIIETYLRNYNSDINDLDKEGNTVLMYMLSDQKLYNFDVIKLLLEYGCNASIQNIFGNTALLLSTFHKNDLQEKITILLDNNANPSAVNKNGETALISICKLHCDLDNFENIVKLLLLFDVNINTKDIINGNTVLNIITDSYKICTLNLVQCIVDHNADVNIANNDGKTPLLNACSIPYPDIALDVVSALLKAGANPNATTKKGRNAICTASSMSTVTAGHFRIVERLLSEDISLSRMDQNDLIFNATEIPDFNIAHHLLKVLLNKCTPSNEIVNNKSALLNAISIENAENAFEMVKLLFNAGSNMLVTDEIGNTALMQVCRNHGSCKAGYKMAKLFLGQGVNPAAQNVDGEDALLILLVHGNSSNDLFHISKLILDIGAANIETLDLALVYATKFIHSPKIRNLVGILLLSHGATPIALDHNNTALHYASIIDDDDVLPGAMVAFLLSANADVNVQNSNGETALIYSLKVPHTQENVNIKFLLKAGSDTSIQDNEGNTALFYAAGSENIYVAYSEVQMLLANQANPSIRNKEGKTAFSIAARRTEVEDLARDMQLAMLNKEGKPSPEDIDVLFFMCQNKDQDFFLQMLPILIKTGVDFSVKDNNGNTPIILSLLSDHPVERLRILLFKMKTDMIKFDINAENNEKDCALHVAANIATPNVAYDCVVELLNAGANPNRSNKKETSVLITATDNSDPMYGPMMVEALLKSGADPSASSSAGVPTLVYAFANRNIDIALQNVKFLISAGADISVKRSNNQNLLTWACMSYQVFENRHLIIKHLIECGVTIEISERTFLETNLLNSLFLEETNYPMDTFGVFLQTFINRIETTGIIKNLAVIRRRIHKLFDLGFSVKPASPPLLSPLTILVSLDTTKIVRSLDGVEYSDREKRTMIASLAKEFVLRGADVSQRMLTFRNPELQRLSDELHLPDALWVAAVTGNYESVAELLVYWARPPLALLIFLDPRLCDDPEGQIYLKSIVRQFIPILVEGGPLPLGTQIFRRVSSLFEMMVVEDLVEDDAIVKFQNKHSVVPSLLNISRLTIRSHVSPGPGFSKRLSQLGLPRYLVGLLHVPNTEDW